jgi:uncharacterized protein YjiS (DUF1127 family)
MMSTYPTVPGTHADVGVAGKPFSWLRRVFGAVVAARQAEARRQVAGFLATQSDARLKDLGFNESQIREVRVHGRLPVSYWS